MPACRRAIQALLLPLLRHARCSCLRALQWLQHACRLHACAFDMHRCGSCANVHSSVLMWLRQECLCSSESLYPPIHHDASGCCVSSSAHAHLSLRNHVRRKHTYSGQLLLAHAPLPTRALYRRRATMLLTPQRGPTHGRHFMLQRTPVCMRARSASAWLKPSDSCVYSFTPT